MYLEHSTENKKQKPLNSMIFKELKIKCWHTNTAKDREEISLKALNHKTFPKILGLIYACFFYYFDLPLENN